MRINSNESVTFPVAGAVVTLPAATLADLWINKVIEGSRSIEFIAGETVQRCLALPKLNPGEVWVGIINDDDDSPHHHLILLPGECDACNHGTAGEWAKGIGGVLPDRRESRLLMANAKKYFKDAAYWTSEQHAATSDYAWSQHFDDGGQDLYHKLDELVARAVRRSEIE